jgi:hypothetical protein
MRHERRRQHSCAERVTAGYAVVAHLLVEKELRHVGGGLASVLRGPGEVEPSEAGEFASEPKSQPPLFIVRVIADAVMAGREGGADPV